MFVAGLALFTARLSRGGARADMDALIVARAIQGIGGGDRHAADADHPQRRVPEGEARPGARAPGRAIAGLAVASGRSSAERSSTGSRWQWIFWLNVPIGIVLVPLAYGFLRETHGPKAGLDLPGLALVSAGLFGLVWGLINGNGDGWTSPQIVASLGLGALLTASFVAWELRAAEPMLPMRFFRDRAFAAANGASLLMYFGMFGSIFLLAQFLQTVQGHSPLGAGLRILPWTAMPMIVAPIAGALSDRIGGRPLMAGGLALQAIGLGWLAAVSTPTVPYTELVIPLHPQRHRHGDVLRAGRERRALVGAARGGRQGLRHQQRDP